MEHDLFDQLNLIQLLSWIRGRLPVGKEAERAVVAEAGRLVLGVAARELHRRAAVRW